MDSEPSTLLARMSIPEDSAGQDSARTASVTPYKAYLDTLSPAGRTTMKGCLDRLARFLTGEDPADISRDPGASLDWWNLTVADVSTLRARMDAEAWAPATANKHLSALRQVLRQSWKLGLMDAETLARVADVNRFEGTRLPKGRAFASDELTALLDACSDDTPKGARDAGVIAVLYATGCRRSEIAGLNLDHWTASTRQFRVIGKRNKERMVPLAAEGVPWLMAWLKTRQWAPGPLFCPVRKSGRVTIGRLTGQTVWDILDARAKIAGVEHPRPHDFRRTVIGDLLTAGVDLATVQKFAGHSSPATTSRYDRRGDELLTAAVDRLHLHQPGGAS